jgi:hypothetical protein
MLALLCFFGSMSVARGDEAIQVLRNTHQVRFAQGITFDLEVSASEEIREVTLYYRRAGEGATVRVPIEAEPGEQSFTYTWDLEPGGVPVGERIEHYWHLADAGGNEVETAAVSLEYVDDRFDWHRLEGGNIVLLWYESTESEARRLLDLATQSLARLQDEMGARLNQPVHIYVYRSKSDMSLALPQRSDAYDDRILTLGVVVDNATLLLLGTHSDVEGTIAHELSHVVVGLATDNPYVSLPRWLDEGLAMYSEGALPAGNQRALDSAIRRDELISVRSLSAYTGDPAQVDLFYGEVYSLVEYLLQAHGKDKMSELLDSYTAGITQEEALHRTYDIGVDALDSQWRQSLGLEPRAPREPGAPPPQKPAREPSIPCPGTVFGGLIGLTVAAAGRRRARAG